MTYAVGGDNPQIGKTPLFDVKGFIYYIKNEPLWILPFTVIIILVFLVGIIVGNIMNKPTAFEEEIKNINNRINQQGRDSRS